MRRPLHCDVLPLHPSIEPHEALTSYCTRIGQENLIKSVTGISDVLFPEINPRQTFNLSDFPIHNFSTMAKVVQQPESRILESTFYYLGRNFGKSTRSQSLSLFLRGAISPSLRYCPECVRETGYYSILWRFNHITGCNLHGCHLINACPHCHNIIPLFTAPFRIGRCPKCGGKLEDGKPKQLSEQDWANEQSLYEDLKLLLNPSGFQKQFYVGGILRLYRLYKGIEVAQIARALERDRTVITNSESVSANKGTISFSEYLEYIQLLGSPFHEIILSPFELDSTNNTILIPYAEKEIKKNAEKSVR